MLHHHQNIQSLEESDFVEAMDAALHRQSCLRCGGLLIQDHCYDVFSDSGEVMSSVYRCCGCGEIIDPLILKNRMKSANFSISLVHRPHSVMKQTHRTNCSNSFVNEILETWSSAVHQDDLHEVSRNH